MKNIYLFTILIFSVFFSCSSENFDKVSTSEDELGYVTFNFGGEFVKDEDTPLTKASTNFKTYYGLSIEEVIVEEKLMTGHVVKYTFYNDYAHGLFTTKENMKVALPLNKQFRIQSTIVKEVEDSLYHEGNAYYYPFCSEYNESKVLNNKFTISNDKTYIPYYTFDQSEISVNSKVGTKHTKIDRYYGCDFFTPTLKNNIIDLHLNRYSFGLKFIVTPPLDGYLKIEGKSPKFEHIIKSSMDRTFESYQLYAGDFTTKRDTEIMPITITWYRPDESKNIISKDLIIKRNTVKVVTIDINNRDYESGFNMILEDAMQEDTEIIN